MIIHVVAALLFSKNNEILVQLRPDGRDFEDYWEFPGGKIESGEDQIAGLKRELHEELGLEHCDVSEKLGQSLCLQGQNHVEMTLYSVQLDQETPLALHAKAIKWVSVDELQTLKMPPVDIALIDDVKRYIAKKEI
jgi:8-oxo-dGTP diphosphatase